MKLQDALNILLDRDARGRYALRKRDLAIVLDESGRTLGQTLESALHSTSSTKESRMPKIDFNAYAAQLARERSADHDSRHREGASTLRDPTRHGAGRLAGEPHVPRRHAPTPLLRRAALTENVRELYAYCKAQKQGAPSRRKSAFLAPDIVSRVLICAHISHAPLPKPRSARAGRRPRSRAQMHDSSRNVARERIPRPAHRQQAFTTRQNAQSHRRHPLGRPFERNIGGRIAQKQDARCQRGHQPPSRAHVASAAQPQRCLLPSQG